MLYNVYTQIKNALLDLNKKSVIQWFNNQYEGSMPASDLFLIQFLEFPIKQATKELKRAKLIVNVHVVSRITSNPDGSISDTLAMSHDARVESVRNALDAYALTNPVTSKQTALDLIGWFPQKSSAGFLVTILQFDLILDF